MRATERIRRANARGGTRLNGALPSTGGTRCVTAVWSEEIWGRPGPIFDRLTADLLLSDCP
jgi:hypothetical protein